MAFNVSINSIAPTPTPSDWVRPSDWPVITDALNEVQFLVADTGSAAFAIQTTFTRTSGNIYIDWGDGVTDTISTITSTTTEHVYSTGGTPCSRGYNTFKIRVYGDPTCVITNARHLSNFTIAGGGPFYNVGLLEAYFGNNTCNGAGFLSSYFLSTSAVGVASFGLLEYVKLPDTVAWTGQMSSMFTGCVSLYKVVMPTSASLLNSLSSTFGNCTNLRDIELPSNATAIVSVQTAFSGCTELRTVSFPTALNSCTSMGSCFQSCSSLKNVTIPSINLVIDMNSSFTGCTSLQWVRFTSLPSPASPTAVDISTCFISCPLLQNVYFPNTCSANAQYNLTSTFQQAYSLKTITFPINFNATTMSSCFQACQSLTNVIFKSAMPALTVFTSCFSGCGKLTSVTLPTTVGSSITMVSMFQDCTSLSSITIPSGWTITSLNLTFSNCQNLKTLTLPNNTQNSITNLASMCNTCVKLESITMPTSMTSATTLSSTFSSCTSLTSVTFPSTMNLVTTAASCFISCRSLISITMPTSMSGCTTFSSTFNGCTSLTSLTLPATVSTGTTTFASTFSGCINLKTLTLPTTQISLLTTLTSTFSQCASLTTINNLGKLGSLTATPLVSAITNTNANQLPALSFSCPFSALALNGTSAIVMSRLNSLRLLNTSAGQWSGTSPQINISFTSLSTAALNLLFADIAAQGNVTTKTINVTGATGVAGLTAADRLVITSKGWSITGVV
jgi:hypothetical protein